MRDYTRGYEEQLKAFRETKIQNEEAGYSNTAKIIVATLIARGENPGHIASILDIDSAVVVDWYRNLFLNQQDLVFRIDDFTYIREKNVVKADARTKGCIVKAVLDNLLTPASAMEAVGVSSAQVIKNWVNEFSRDCEIMMTLPPGSEYKIKTAYAYSKEDAEQVQALIFHHDREENELASRLREEYIAGRV